MIITILDEMIFSQTLEAGRTSKALGDQETCGNSQLVLLSCRPAVNVLKNTREGRFFKGFLEVFIPGIIETRRAYITDTTNLLMSLLSTSTYFFKSSTSAGSFELKMVKGETGAPSSM
jgi:hypothetical protein